jgi:hypothetical protein
MNQPRLARIEKQVTQLPPQEQLWLMERIAHRLQGSSGRHFADESDLAAMAADPEIRRELRAIDEDFRAAEGDGLGSS